jgi:uncharacterized membrane protein HdeD (DUF308 family)
MARATGFADLAAAIGELPKHWWLIALRGLAAIIFGVLAFIWPGITLAVLILFFGAYAIVDGVVEIIVGVRTGGNLRWAALLEGIVGVIAGIVAFVWPGLTALALLFVIAAWAIVTGALEVVAAIRMRNVIDNEWTLIIAGVLSVLFGVVLLAQPGAGALAIVWLIGLYAVVFGIALLALSWRLRGLQQRIDSTVAGARQARTV